MLNAAQRHSRSVSNLCLYRLLKRPLHTQANQASKLSLALLLWTITETLPNQLIMH